MEDDELPDDLEENFIDEEELDVDEIIKRELQPFQRKNKSDNRKKAEEILKNVDMVKDKRLAVINLETKEVHRFDNFFEALEFTKTKKGRWYVTKPGINLI